MTGVTRREPALDGIRGLAITLVIAGHTFPTFYVAAAPVGVSVFFALSGYLITRLLLAEHDRTGRIDLRAFWLRRARRLLPALFVFLPVMLALACTVDPAFGNLAAVWPALLYVANFNRAYEFGDLGGQMAPHEGLEHLWSLSIEEQFYLLFPLALVALLRRRQMVLPALFAAAAASLLLRVWLTGTASIGTVYFRPDTCACLLLAGCLVAVAGRRFPAGIAAPAITALLVLGFLPVKSVLSLPIAAGLAAILIASQASPGWLTWGPLGLLGRRSYALYLWHWPALTAWVLLGGGVALWFTCIGAAWGTTLASWRWVEEPWLRKSVGSPPPPLVRQAR